MNKFSHYMEIANLRDSKALISNLMWAKKHIDQLENLARKHAHLFSDDGEDPSDEVADLRKRFEEIKLMIKDNSKPYQYVYNQIRNLSDDAAARWYNYEDD